MESNDSSQTETIAFWRQRAGCEPTTEEVREAGVNIAGFFRILDEWDRRASEKTERPVEGTVNHAR